MEVDYNSREIKDNAAEEYSESSTTDDSSGVYQYYPHIDFMNVGSTQKVKSSLGRRRRTINPFRLVSGDITEESNEINQSKSSTEDSSSITTRETSTCPSFYDKTEFSFKNSKNSAALDQENRQVLSNCENIERHGFRNVSNFINKAPVSLSQEKSFADDQNKIRNTHDNADAFFNSKIDLQQRNPPYNFNQNQSHKMLLKQNTDNVFLGNATKMSQNQPNAGKNLFEPKYVATTAKENIMSSRENFSSSFQNDKNTNNTSKKFEPQNFFKVRPTESHLSFKGLHKATSLDDLPLDLKLKFKAERANNRNVFGALNDRVRKMSEMDKENDPNRPMKLKLNLDSKDFINIFDMPSVKLNPDFDSPKKPIHSSLTNLTINSENVDNYFKEPSIPDVDPPKKPIHSSLTNLTLNSQNVVNHFKEPSIPFSRNQPSDLLSQELNDSSNYSALNLSMDNSSKAASNQANNSISESKVSPKNYFSSDSDIPSSVQSENSHRKVTRNDSLIFNSGSDNSNSSVSLNLSTKNTSFERVKHGSSEVDAVPKPNFSINSTVAVHANAPLTFHRNSNTIPPPINKPSVNLHRYPEPHSDIPREGRTFNAGKQSPESDNPFGKQVNPVSTNMESSKEVPKGITATDSERNHQGSSKYTEGINAGAEKNIFNFGTNKENLAKMDPFMNKSVQLSKPLPFDTRALAQEIFKKPSEPILPMKIHGPDPFKKPSQPLSITGGGSGIPVAVSQAPVNNSNFVLPKLNPRPSKPTYSFASDVAKFCQKEGGRDIKLNSLKNPPSNTQAIKINNKAYHILSSLGRGGSSEVYQVLDPSNKALLAVKCVKLSSVDESIAEGYMNEVKLLEKLQDCSCVIRMFDYEYFQDCKKLFVVMEKGDTDLSKLIKDINKTKRISMSMIIYYWTEMLTAVREIHEKGIIHSDLKPANFLLVSGRLKLIDFGIASSLQGDMTSVHKDICAGTENYMSPEAIQDGTGGHDKKFKISYKSDVWSLGCILYNLVYGKTPFSHIPSRFGKMYAIISPNHKIDFPDHPMPPVLRSALQSCLIRDPKQRPTVKELLDLPYHAATLPKDLAFKIQQNIHEECWQKIAHLFSETMKSNPS